MTEPPDGLTIGEMARQTRVPAATLRSWEDRYGFPRPRRLAAGHRRYDRSEVALIEAILRLRATGVSLKAAIGQIAARPPAGESSLFAGLRREYPELIPQVMRKVTLLALSRAIEDECCARAGLGVLFAGFQRQRFFARSQQRWNELARTARLAVVFADFEGPAATSEVRPGERAPVRVPLAPDAPARREWILVCESDYPACLVGWELPGQHGVADAGRRFEVIWSMDPPVVRDAAVICAHLARAGRPDLAPVLDRLASGPAAAASADLHRAAGLLSRMTGYLEQAVPGPFPAR